ncbi:MAG: glycoside hydrolase family 15 protein [Myxococcota bacterium]
MNKIYFFPICFLVLFIFNFQAYGQEPHLSFYEMASSNGYSSVHYSFYESDRKTAAFYPHIYRKWDADTPETPNLLYDAYFGIRVAEAHWFSSIVEDNVSYENGTGIIVVERTIPAGVENILVKSYIFSPFALETSGYVMLLEIQGPAPPLAAFSLHNFHVGEGEFRTENESLRISGTGMLEEGAGGGVYYRTLSSADGYLVGAGSQGPYQIMLDGADFNQSESQFEGDDQALGYQFNLSSGVASGESVWLGIVIGAGEPSQDINAIAQIVDAYVEGETPESLLQKERDNWISYQNSAQFPANIDEEEEKLLRQGLAVLRFAQVREPNTEDGSPFGQILAALPKARPDEGEGIWNMAWVRDGSYGIAALAQVGLLEEARYGLEFMLNAQSGEYEHAVGYPYQISICRYYGSGREETDSDHNGPNIEYDDFGLFLWALTTTVLAEPNNDWWKQYWPIIRDLTADVLVKLTERSTFLIAPDSSIWERHWNGNEKHFTYTSIMAVKGLCGASLLAAMMDEPEKEEEYLKTAAEIIRGIEVNLLDSNNILAGSLEELENDSGYIDLAVVEAFNFGLFDPEGVVTQSTLNHFNEYFFDGVENGHGGYFRNDDGDWYDYQEWSFVDLRVSIALGLAGMESRRDALLNWVLEQSAANNYLMGELYCRGEINCEQRGDYKGSIPMVGFGPGAYILALKARNGNGPTELCTEAVEYDPGLDDPSTTDGGIETDVEQDSGQSITPGGSSGCSCSNYSGSEIYNNYLVLIFLFCVVFFIKRKQLTPNF